MSNHQESNRNCKPTSLGRWVPFRHGILFHPTRIIDRILLSRVFNSRLELQGRLRALRHAVMSREGNARVEQSRF
jgi:hypothetical protein